MKKFKNGNLVIPTDRMLKEGKLEWPRQKNQKFKPIPIQQSESVDSRSMYDVKGISISFYSYELKKIK